MDRALIFFKPATFENSCQIVNKRQNIVLQNCRIIFRKARELSSCRSTRLTIHSLVLGFTPLPNIMFLSCWQNTCRPMYTRGRCTAQQYSVLIPQLSATAAISGTQHTRGNASSLAPVSRSCVTLNLRLENLDLYSF